MGQKPCRKLSVKNEKQYFMKKNKEMIEHFAKVDGFLENSSEWIVIFREEMEAFKQSPWCKPVVEVIQYWQSYHDSSSKVAFVWNKINSMRNVPTIDQSRACLWPQSITNLQTFSYEVETDPHKKALHAFLIEKKDCTLYRIIRKFRQSFVSNYCYRKNSKLSLKPEYYENILGLIQDTDEIILSFILILVKVIPKFFLGLPNNIKDVQGIVRNAIISNELLAFLVLLRKESFQETQDVYLRGLQSFNELKVNCLVLRKLVKDRNENYMKAVANLVEITSCKSIGEIHDSVAMLMNNISMCLFNESNPEEIATEEDILQAFLLVIGESNTHDLPLYLGILNRFLDNDTLHIKEIGQGIHKLTFIVNNSKDWSSFISN
ncbi:hypothetical protein SteCoe_20626 [Stentor coeruleus]|uniref:Uncharacterized protein n=1 Tax=Stentor coeruleus TaxID=5963 RepID=A0A1R2BRD1_9CILI|nr:hypothetical protein SteCoe_20626 [Stentor coeruleus]